MKKTILSAAMAALTLTVAAAPRSLEEMRAIAASYLHNSHASAARKAPAAMASPRLIDATRAYAIFSAPGDDGFVIVSGDDDARPVLGYSPTAFPSYDMPDGLQWYLQQLELRADGPSARRNAATYTAVPNFVTTTWDQDYPFNKLTPDNCPAGCVATALAQCMNYCQWPSEAAFTGSCRVTKKVGRKEKTEQQELDINSTYTWPYEDNYATVGRVSDNIDELLRDCGYATYMSYSPSGSGTASILAGIALTHEFGYPQQSVRYLQREDVATQDEWAQLIYDELGRRCPVFFGASDESFGGHAFLLTGVDADGLVYVNWGWRGSADGWFDLTNLSPSQGEQDMHFLSDMEIVYGIRKEPLPTDRFQVSLHSYSGEDYTYDWRTMTDDANVSHNTLYISLPHGFMNYQPSDFMGVFGIFADDLTDGSTWVIEPDLQDRDTLPSGYIYGGSDDRYEDFAFYYYVDGAQGLKAGHTYRMSFGYCDDREQKWHSIICGNREIAYEVKYTGDVATSTVTPEPTTPPVLTGIGSLHANGSNLGRYERVSAITRVYDADGRLVHTAPTSDFNLWDIPVRGILIVDDGQTRRKIVR